MIPLAIPVLTGNERKYLNQCIDDGFVSSVGPFVTRFEKMLAETTGAKQAVAVSSGTCALHLALIATAVKPNELVIIPSYTFIATANAVSHCGAIPWLIDIDPADWGMDMRVLEEELSRNTLKKDGQLYHKTTNQRVAAIMPVYTMGMPVNLEELERIATAYNIPVVLDAAAAIGSLYKGMTLGKQSPYLTAVSFNGNKNITTGGGGAVLGNDLSLTMQVKHISSTARVESDYDHDQVGFNYRMTNIEAAIGCAQLEQIERFQNKKRYIREFYNAHLATLPDTRPFPEMPDRISSYWLSGIYLENADIRTIIDKLRARGVEARMFWKPIHMQRPYMNCPKSTMKISEEIWDKVLVLPCSVSITDDDLEQVRQIVTDILKESA